MGQGMRTLAQGSYDRAYNGHQPTNYSEMMIARRADATVVCARRDFSRIDQVTEAYTRLRAAGVCVAGTVLNGIPPSTYAYRYGSHYYDRSFPSDDIVAEQSSA